MEKELTEKKIDEIYSLSKVLGKCFSNMSKSQLKFACLDFLEGFLEAKSERDSLFSKEVESLKEERDNLSSKVESLKKERDEWHKKFCELALTEVKKKSKTSENENRWRSMSETPVADKLFKRFSVNVELLTQGGSIVEGYFIPDTEKQGSLVEIYRPKRRTMQSKNQFQAWRYIPYAR